MKKKWKQQVIFCLVLCLTLMLCGCGKDQDLPKEETAAELPAESEMSEAEQSGSEAAEPETSESETTEPESRPSEGPSRAMTELPSHTVLTEGDRYLFNPYLVSEELAEAMGPEFVDFYVGFLKAYLAYDTVCACPSESCAMSLDMALSYECPYYGWNDIEYSWATNYDRENNTIYWTYNISEEDLNQRYEAVAEAMQAFLDQVSADDTEADKVQTLYHAFCPLMTYDYERAESREFIESCYPLIEHRGICVSFSNAFAQLLSQAGIYATISNGETVDGESHGWNYVRVDGEFYYFDTTFELNYMEGNAFVYYGMTKEERIQSGIPEDMIWNGRYMELDTETPEIHLNVH